MRRLVLALGLTIATPAAAGEFVLKGQWETRWPSGKYVGIVLIDSERRATWDSPSDQGRVAKFVGHVAEASESKIVLHMTDRDVVAKVHCDIRSTDLLHCYVIRASGMRSDNFLMVKTGAGPHRLNQPGQ